MGYSLVSAPHVLLINTNCMRPPIAPLGLDYMAGALEDEGISTTILDVALEEAPLNAVERHLKSNSPTLIGVTVRNTDDCYFLSQDFLLPPVREILQRVRELSDAPVVLGGVGFSVMPEAILEFLDVDWGIWGDGEKPLAHLAIAVSHGKDPRGTPGFIYREGGLFRRNPPEFHPLDLLPLERRQGIDNARYFREGGQGGVETKRGCPGLCIYCADPPAKGRVPRLRSPEKVAGEFESLLSQGVTHLHLCDSEFNLPLEHALEVSRELIARRLGEKIKWWAYLAPKPFPRELGRLMKRAGCAGINFGADSGSDRMLKRLGRDFEREGLRETARICREEGITLMFDLLLGGPGEDKESLRETVSLMKEIGPDRVGASLGVRVYPGTELARLVKSEGLGEQNPNLRGTINGNGSFLKPIFYLSRKMGNDPEGYLMELIQGDERFFLGSRPGEEGSYNYNANEVLLEAIRSGERGAYWDILRRVTSP